MLLGNASISLRDCCHRKEVGFKDATLDPTFCPNTPTTWGTRGERISHLFVEGVIVYIASNLPKYQLVKLPHCQLRIQLSSMVSFHHGMARMRHTH